MGERGSEKLRKAWAAREVVTEESVAGLAELLDGTAGTVESVQFHGGAQPSGVSLGVAFSGDDAELCPRFVKDLLGLLGGSRLPELTTATVLINGTPAFWRAIVTVGEGPVQTGPAAGR